MNKKEFPIILLRDIADVVKTARLNKDIYADLIDTDIVDFDVTYRDKDKSSNFYFSLSNPNFANYGSGSKSYYKIILLPHTVNSVQQYSSEIEVKEIWNFFKHWIEMLKEYNSISLSQEDEFVKHYQEEYFDEWKVVDEDADEKPFNNQQQTAIFKLLEYVEIKLKEDDNQDSEITNIIEETKSLKASIQNLTKNAVVKSLSRIFAKIKKKGLALLLELSKEVKKEIIKKVITEGFDIASIVMHHLA